MSLYCATLNLAVSFLITTQPPPRDQEKLQGTWNVVKGVANGKDETADTLKGARIVFAGDRMTLISFVRVGIGTDTREDRREFTFKLDSSMNPRTINVTAKSGPFKAMENPGIYSLAGDTLKLCLPNRTTTRRPTDFKSEKGSDLVYLELKRAAK
jgi:uncharacterized protein (TIGR03067 family)